MMDEDRSNCSYCGALEGHLHDFMCDFERCPFCGGQLLTCECCYYRLGFLNYRRYGAETGYLPPDIYENGLSESQAEQWLQVCEKKGRVPYICWPNMCGRCGLLWPEMFQVSDEEWEKHIEPGQRDKMLCRSCYDKIKRWIEEKISDA